MILIAAISGCANGVTPLDRLKAHLQLKKGNQSYLAGKYDQAIRNYDLALQYAPRLAPAALNRAYSQEALFRATEDPQQRQKMADQAVQSFDQYLRLMDEGAVRGEEAAMSRARVEDHVVSLLVDSQQASKAIDRLRARYEKNPRDISALTLLSRLDMERGNLDEAMDWQRKRVAVAPDDPDAQYSFGAFVWLLSYRDKEMDPAKRSGLLDEGMAALQKALQLRPNDFQTLIYINLLYIERSTYAPDDAQKAEFAAVAKGYRERALALRKAPGDTTAQAAAGEGAVPAKPAAQPGGTAAAETSGGKAVYGSGAKAPPAAAPKPKAVHKAPPDTGRHARPATPDTTGPGSLARRAAPETTARRALPDTSARRAPPDTTHQEPDSSRGPGR